MEALKNVFSFCSISCKIQKNGVGKIKFYGKISESCSNEKHDRDFFFFLPQLVLFSKKYDTCHLKTSRWEKKSHMISIKIGSFCLPESI